MVLKQIIVYEGNDNKAQWCISQEKENGVFNLFPLAVVATLFLSK